MCESSYNAKLLREKKVYILPASKRGSGFLACFGESLHVALNAWKNSTLIHVNHHFTPTKKKAVAARTGGLAPPRGKEPHGGAGPGMACHPISFPALRAPKSFLLSALALTGACKGCSAFILSMKLPQVWKPKPLPSLGNAFPCSLVLNSWHCLARQARPGSRALLPEGFLSSAGNRGCSEASRLASQRTFKLGVNKHKSESTGLTSLPRVLALFILSIISTSMCKILQRSAASQLPVVSLGFVRT